MSKRDTLFGESDNGTDMVPVPEWPGVREIKIRSLSALEQSEWETKSEGQPALRKATLMLVASCVEDDGSQMFTVDDVDKLEQKRFAPIFRIYRAALELNGLTTKSQEAIRKNSETGQSDASPSA